MPALAVNSTDFSRNLSEYLNQVQYRGQVLEISRGKKLIARVVPVTPAEGFPTSEVDKLIAGLPKLDPEDSDLWLAELAESRQEKITFSNLWED
jgi:prevent-host-death family protein